MWQQRFRQENRTRIRPDLRESDTETIYATGAVGADGATGAVAGGTGASFFMRPGRIKSKGEMLLEA